MPKLKMKPDKIISDAIAFLSKARTLFAKAQEEGLILGNDNHIGDIGEYWVMKYYLSLGQFKEYAPKKNSKYDIKLTNNSKVSVKTISGWAKHSYGSQIKMGPECEWTILAGVALDDRLYPCKIAIVNINEVKNKEPFLSNAVRIGNGNVTYPRFKWWKWLDEYLIDF